MWRFIRSFLAVLLTLSSTFDSVDSIRFNSLLGDLAVVISSEILANDNAKRASFEMMSKWYSEKGYLNSSWIELLDLRKWIPAPEISEPEDFEEESNPYEEYGDEEESEDEDDEEEDEEGTSYHASLAGGQSLVINQNDTRHVFAVSTASGLCAMEPKEAVDLLSRFSEDGTVTDRQFLNFLNACFGTYDLQMDESATNDVRNKVFADMFSIYKVFERHSDTNRGAEFRSLAVGLTLLCKGSKSTKLETGFRVFEEERIGYISPDSLSSFLASYLLVLTALGVISDSVIAIDTAFSLGEVISGLLDNSLTFNSFGKWYNEEGCEYAPWIELLNLEKWTRVTGFEDVQYEEEEVDVEEEEENDDEEDEEDEEVNEPEDAFSILLKSQEFERTIAVSKECASKVYHFTNMFRSDSSDIPTLISLLKLKSVEGLIQKNVYIYFCSQLGFYCGPLHGGDQFVSVLFDAFDRSNSGVVDMCELATGLAMMDHQGTKSEKLVYAFDFIDQNETGKISKREIWKFFRSFLISVLLLCCPELKPSDYLHIVADESAVWVVESILGFIAKESNETPSHVSFDDIADWYTSEGSTSSAWIELLDFNKWIHLSSR